MRLKTLKELKDKPNKAGTYKKYEVLTNLIALAGEQNSSDGKTINPINPKHINDIINKEDPVKNLESVQNQFGSLCSVRNYLSHNHHTEERIYFCPDVLSRIKTDFAPFVDTAVREQVLAFIFPTTINDYTNNSNIDVKIIYILLIIINSPYRLVYFNNMLLALESYYNSNDSAIFIDCKVAISRYYNYANKAMPTDLNFTNFVHETFTHDEYTHQRVKDDNWAKNFMEYSFDFLCSQDFFKDICKQTYFDREDNECSRPKYKTVTRLNAIYFNKTTDDKTTYIASMAFLVRCLLLYLTDEAKFKLGDEPYTIKQPSQVSNATKPDVLAMVRSGWSILADLPNELSSHKFNKIKERSIKTKIAKLVWRYLHRLDDDVPNKPDEFLLDSEKDDYLAKVSAYKTAKKYEYRSFIEAIVGMDFDDDYQLNNFLKTNQKMAKMFDSCMTDFKLEKGDFTFIDFYQAMCSYIISNPKASMKNNLAGVYNNKNLVYKLPAIDEITWLSKLGQNDIATFANSDSSVKSKILAVLQDYNKKASIENSPAKNSDEKKLYYRALENVSIYMAYKKANKPVLSSQSNHKHENLALKDKNAKISYLSAIDLGFTLCIFDKEKKTKISHKVYIINKERGFLVNYINKKDNITHLKTFLQVQFDNKKGYKLADKNEKHMLSKKTLADDTTVYLMEENFFIVYLQYLAGLFTQIYRFECAVLKDKTIDPKIVFVSFNKVIASDTFLANHKDKDALIKVRNSVAHVNIVDINKLKSAENLINGWYKEKNIKTKVDFRVKYCRNQMARLDFRCKR